MENQVIKDQTLQGCHYVIIGFRALKLLSGHIENLYFVAINARDVGKITQRTLGYIYRAQPFNTVTWYDLLLRGDQINEFAAMSETELRLMLQ